MILYNLFILYNYSLNRKSVDTRYIEDRISWSICILYNLRNWLRNLHVSFISRIAFTETHISTQLWMHQLHENDPICWSSTCVHSIIPLSRSYLSKMLAGFRVHKHWLNKFMQFQFCKIKSTLSSLSLYVDFKDIARTYKYLFAWSIQQYDQNVSNSHFWVRLIDRSSKYRIAQVKTLDGQIAFVWMWYPFCKHTHTFTYIYTHHPR